MKKTHVLFTAIALMFCAACKKDNKNPNMDLITSGDWKIISVIANPPFDYDGDGIDDSEIFPLYDACEKDDYYTFKSNGILEVNAGSTKCDPQDPQIIPATWEFADNEKSIVIDGEKGTINELTSSNLRFTFAQPGESTTIKMIKR